MLNTIERDPWGRLYLVVMSKLRVADPPLTDTMNPEVLEDVLEMLFPSDEEKGDKVGAACEADWENRLAITDDELMDAVRHIRSGCVAHGPDGITSRNIISAVPELKWRLIACYTRCLQDGRFPNIWKTGRIILLRKMGRPDEMTSSYCLIFLLDELGKLLERIIASRIYRHLRQHELDFSDAQCGFRVGRSTIDAVHRVRGHVA